MGYGIFLMGAAWAITFAVAMKFYFNTKAVRRELDEERSVIRKLRNEIGGLQVELQEAQTQITDMDGDLRTTRKALDDTLYCVQAYRLLALDVAEGDANCITEHGVVSRGPLRRKFGTNKVDFRPCVYRTNEVDEWLIDAWRLYKELALRIRSSMARAA